MKNLWKFVGVCALAFASFAACTPKEDTPAETGDPLAAPTGLQSTVDQNRVSLSWNSVSGADSYTVRIGTDQYPATDAFLDDLELNPGETYRWRVAAIKGGKTGEWSAQATFTTDDIVLGADEYLGTGDVYPVSSLNQVFGTAGSWKGGYGVAQEDQDVMLFDNMFNRNEAPGDNKVDWGRIAIISGQDSEGNEGLFLDITNSVAGGTLTDGRKVVITTVIVYFEGDSMYGLGLAPGNIGVPVNYDAEAGTISFIPLYEEGVPMYYAFHMYENTDPLTSIQFESNLMSNIVLTLGTEQTRALGAMKSSNVSVTKFGKDIFTKTKLNKDIELSKRAMVISSLKSVR